MPAERAPMRKVREVLRLRHALGVSERQIAVTVGVSRSTVGEYLRRAAVIGITWPVPEGLDDGELERRLFTPPTFDEKPGQPLPDWSYVHKELKRRSVTLLLLWEEYRAEYADGYGYSRFCDLHRDWRKTISPTMRQMHGPAEKLFVDFAGDTVAVFDAFLSIYKARIADLLRIATAGTGELPKGDIHPDLVDRLARRPAMVREAVLAVPPSARYRLRKFVRRNRGPVLAAGLVLAALRRRTRNVTLQN